MKTNEKPLYVNSINLSLHFVVSLMMLLLGCKCHGPIIQIKSQVKAMQGIAFLVLKDGESVNVHKIKVTLIDPEKMVLSPNGIAFDSIELSEGVMSVGFSPNAQFSIERPYHFSIRAEAEGYMTAIRSIIITDSTPNYIPVYMVKLDSLPSHGLAASVGALNTISGGTVTQDQTIGVKLEQQKADSLAIKIYRGTRLLYNDKPVQTDSPLSFRLLFCKPKDSLANLAFPGGFEVAEATSQNGEKIANPANPIFFTTAGWFSMEMNIGKTKVNGFSTPLDVEIPIEDTIINPATHRVVKAGDTIPIWSLNNQTGIWHLETNAEVMSSSNGGLKVNMRVNHLSTFNLDYYSGGSCTVSLNYNTSNFSGLHYSEFYRTSNSALIMGKTVDYSISPGTLDILRVPDYLSSSDPGKLFVHLTTNPNSPILGGLQNITCTPPWNDIQLIGSNSFQSITIKFVRESNGTPVLNNVVWHKPIISAPNWEHVGTLDNTPNSGLLVIPLDPQINQALHLFYLKSSTMTEELTFTMNFTASGTGNVTDGTSPTSFNYTVVSPGPGTSQRLITITIPSAYL